MTNPRVAHCIFCDDIRFEQGNKVSFMGLYGNDMVISSPKPARIRLAIVTWIISDIDDSPTEVRMWGTGPAGDQKLFEGVYNFPAAPTGTDARKTHLRAHIVIDGLEVPDDGLIAVYVDTPSGPLRAGRLTLRYGALPPPQPIVQAAVAGPDEQDEEAKRRFVKISSNETQQPSPLSPDDAQETGKKPGRGRPSGRPASPKRPRKRPSPS